MFGPEERQCAVDLCFTTPPATAGSARILAHFMRNVLSKTPPSHREWASSALKAVFARESREAALAKTGAVAAEMESGKPRPAANCLREGIGKTTAYLSGEPPSNHRIKPRTNNMIERLNREIRRRMRVAGCFPRFQQHPPCSYAPVSDTSPHRQQPATDQNAHTLRHYR